MFHGGLDIFSAFILLILAGDWLAGPINNVMNTNSPSGKDNLNAVPPLLAEKFEGMGDSQKRALEYLALFSALSLCYSLYLKPALGQSSCSASPVEVALNLALLVPILKFFLFTGWSCALVAALDPNWRSKDAAPVVLTAYAATSVFWIHQSGGNFCPYCVLYWMLACLGSASIGQWIGCRLRALRLPGKTLIIAGGLMAVVAAVCLGLTWTRKTLPARNTTATVNPAETAAPTPTKVPVADAAPMAKYGAMAQKAAETPHFWQLDPRGGFANGGRDFCGPVAISDSLVYLAHHGFPELLPAGEGDTAQIALINLLASPHYLGTDPDKGTGCGSVLKGIEKYVVANGYQCTTMEYKGLKVLGRREEEFNIADRPDLDWMKRGILDPHGAVWLDVGWYSQMAGGQWKRTGGHWVPMVGFDATDEYALLIHNPGTRGNGDRPDDPAKDVVHLKPVDGGTLDTGYGPAEDAAGRYQIAGPGLPMGRDQVAFLEAAIVVVVSKL